MPQTMQNAITNGYLWQQELLQCTKCR